MDAATFFGEMLLMLTTFAAVVFAIVYALTDRHHKAGKQTTDYERLCMLLTQIEADTAVIKNRLVRELFTLCCRLTRDYLDANDNEVVRAADVPIFLDLVQALRELQLAELRLRLVRCDIRVIRDRWKIVLAAGSYVRFVHASITRGLKADGYLTADPSASSLTAPADKLIAYGKLYG